LTDALQELDDLNLDNLTNGAKMRTYLEGLGDLFRTAFRVEGHAVAPIAHTDIGYALQQKGQHKVCFEPFSSLQEFNQDFVQQWLRADGAKCRGLAVRVQLNPCPTGDEAASQEAQTLDSIYLPPLRLSPRSLRRLADRRGIRGLMLGSGCRRHRRRRHRRRWHLGAEHYVEK
jgi:hypothetical protein